LVNTEHLNKLCGQDVEFYNAEIVVRQGLKF